MEWKSSCTRTSRPTLGSVVLMGSARWGHAQLHINRYTSIVTAHA